MRSCNVPCNTRNVNKESGSDQVRWQCPRESLNTSLAAGVAEVKIHALVSVSPHPTRPLSASTMFRITRLSPSALWKWSLTRTLATATLQLPVQPHGNLPTSQSPITPKLHFFNSVTEEGKQIPTYRVLDGAGKPLEGAELPDVRVDVSFTAVS